MCGIRPPGGCAIEIQHATRDGCVVVAFTGDIDLLSVPQIQRTLLKDLSDQPFALICDLAGVDTLDPVCATVFSAVANHPASRWPDTSFLLCRAPPPVAEILDRLQVPHFLHMYASLQEALDAAAPGRRTFATSCGWRRPRPPRRRPAPSCVRRAGTGGSPAPAPP